MWMAVVAITTTLTQADQPVGGQQHGDGAGDLQEDERGVHRGDEEVQLPRGGLHVGPEQSLRLAHSLDSPDLQRRRLPGPDFRRKCPF